MDSGKKENDEISENEYFRRQMQLSRESHRINYDPEMREGKENNPNEPHASETTYKEQLARQNCIKHTAVEELLASKNVNFKAKRTVETNAIAKSRRLFLFFFILSIVVPLIVLFGLLMYNSEAASNWTIMRGDECIYPGTIDIFPVIATVAFLARIFTLIFSIPLNRKIQSNHPVLHPFFASLLTVPYIVYSICMLYNSSLFTKYPTEIYNTKKARLSCKSASMIFLSIFIISVIVITVFSVPKYGKYGDWYSSTGYYPIYQNNAQYDIDSENATEPLIVDVKQWGILFVAECAIFLVPSIIFLKLSKQKKE